MKKAIALATLLFIVAGSVLAQAHTQVNSYKDKVLSDSDIVTL